MMKLNAALFALACFIAAAVGCKQPPAPATPAIQPTAAKPIHHPTDEMSEDEISLAVMVTLTDRYGLPRCGNTYEDPCSPETIKGARHQMQCVRDWIKSQTDQRLVGEYLNWLTYFGKEYDVDERRNKHGNTAEENPYTKAIRDMQKANENADKLPMPIACAPEAATQ